MDIKIPKKLNKFYIRLVCPFFNKIKNISHRNKIIFIFTIFLAIIYLLFGKDSIFIDKNTIKRTNIGEINRDYTVYVSSDNTLKNKELNFKINSKRISKDEADEYFYNLFYSILPEILNKNDDFLNIKTNLNLKSNYKNGIKANWRFTLKDNSREKLLKYSNLIDGYGNVNNKNFNDNEEVEGALNVHFSIDVADDEKPYKSDNYSIDVKVVKRDETKEERLIREIKNNIDYQNKNNLDEDIVVLPNTINNEQIKYNEKFDFSFIYILILGLSVSIILEVRDKDIVKKQQEKDKRDITIDFPQIITKLLIYINAGVTISNAFIIISDNYDNKLRLGQVEKRKSYEEIKLFKKKISGGENEEEALYEIARNLNDSDWTRFFNILIQNIKNGTKDIKNILEVEAYDALYKMKANAERLAEEASTKLILPLMMMLMIIFAIIMIPAFMSM